MFGFCNPCARAEFHQQKPARKLWSAISSCLKQNPRLVSSSFMKINLTSVFCFSIPKPNTIESRSEIVLSSTWPQARILQILTSSTFSRLSFTYAHAQCVTLIYTTFLLLACILKLTSDEAGMPATAR